MEQSDKPPSLDPEALLKRLLSASAELRDRLGEVDRAIAGSLPPQWSSLDELEELFESYVSDARLIHFRLTGHHFQDGVIKRED